MSLTHRIDHVGIAVPRLDDAIPLYRDLLGLPFEGTEIVEREGVRVAFFRISEVRLELLEPIAETSPIARFLAERGAGIHHIALAVDDIQAARTATIEFGARLLTPEARQGAHGSWVSFLHPKDTGRVLIEWVQPASGGH